MSEPILLVRDLRLQRRGQVLLHAAELRITLGTCTVLTGSNGTGKTTLLRALAGLDQPAEGELEFRGRPLPWRKARREYAGDVIYLHQDPYLFDASVTDNVVFGLRGRGLSVGEIHERVQRALQRGGLAHLAGRNARELSGGERQRVALVRAWILKPAVLLLDEPMSSLDARAREETRQLIEQLKRDAITMVVVSHDASHLAGVTDRHLHLENGRLQQLHFGAIRPRGAVLEISNDLTG